jgi:hypothetical protein
MRTIFQVAIALLAFSSMARAENGVFVEHVPGGADPEAVLSLIKTSLTYRHWQIDSADASSVSASLDHLDYDAKIRIAFVNGQIVYDVSAIHTMRTGSQGQVMKRPGDVPKRWIGFLRHDISTVVAAMPEKRE